MASIQSAMNQLLGAAAGAATAGSYMYRQSDSFKAKQADIAADKASKVLEKNFNDETGLDNTHTEESAERIVGLREEALTLKPTSKREKALRDAKLYSRDIRSVHEFDEEIKQIQSADRDIKKAEETVRRVLLGQDLIGSKEEQTLRYQEALATLRQGEGEF